MTPNQHPRLLKRILIFLRNPLKAMKSPVSLVMTPPMSMAVTLGVNSGMTPTMTGEISMLVLYLWISFQLHHIMTLGNVSTLVRTCTSATECKFIHCAHVLQSADKNENDDDQSWQEDDWGSLEDTQTLSVSRQLLLNERLTDFKLL